MQLEQFQPHIANIVSLPRNYINLHSNTHRQNARVYETFPI